MGRVAAKCRAGSAQAWNLPQSCDSASDVSGPVAITVICFFDLRDFLAIGL